MDILCSRCDAAESVVIESRGNRRRRECVRCQFRWSTYEVPGERIKELEEAERRLQEVGELLGQPFGSSPDTVPLGLDLELPS